MPVGGFPIDICCHKVGDSGIVLDSQQLEELPERNGEKR